MHTVCRTPNYWVCLYLYLLLLSVCSELFSLQLIAFSNTTLGSLLLILLEDSSTINNIGCAVVFNSESSSLLALKVFSLGCFGYSFFTHLGSLDSFIKRSTLLKKYFLVKKINFVDIAQLANTGRRKQVKVIRTKVTTSPDKLCKMFLYGKPEIFFATFTEQAVLLRKMFCSTTWNT